MNVVIIMGSPRKKDTYRVCKDIESGLNANGINVEYLYLNQLNIQDCKGCDLCFKKSERYCPCKDDIMSVREQLVTAHGIVFASPVYAYQVPAALKRLIDRLSYQFHRPELVGKPAFLIVTSEGGGHTQVMKYLSMTATGWGCNIVGKTSVISPMYFEEDNLTSAWGYNEKYALKLANEIKSSTDILAHACSQNSQSIPSFRNIFMFNCLRSKTYTSQADRDFWNEKGWIESDYFYESKLGIMKTSFSRVLRIGIELASRRLENRIT